MLHAGKYIVTDEKEENGLANTQQDRFKDILKEYWGYPDFRGIQKEIIESISQGKDTLGLMPTGGGKSITFQVPAIAMEGVCIVVTPLIALMKDQVEHLRHKGVKAYAIYGSMQRAEILKILDNAVLGGVTLLYVSPERLSTEQFLIKLKHMKVSFITVDEAHCISQWGYDFRPSYLAISEIRKVKPEAPVLALTATATPATIDDIQDKLGFKQKNVFRMSFERKNLAYIVRETSDKKEQMVHILESVEGSAIVYVYSRQKTKEMAEYLQQAGISATFYHAGLEHSTRDERQTMWQEDKVKVMVATNAFGMGIDKPDVRVVIHIDCPDSIEAYFQEAGRAGRDGKKAYAVMLYSDRDRAVLHNRLADNFPDKDYIKTVYEHIAYFFQLAVGSGFNHTFEFNIEQFCIYFKHFPIKLESALHILEKSGYIEYKEDGETRTRMMFLVDRDELYRLNELSEKYNTLIITLLRCYSGLFSDYVCIDEGIIAKQCDIDEREVYMMLKELNRKHIISFIPRKSTPRIRYTQSRVEQSELIIPQNVYEQRKDLFRARIEAVIDYAENEYICRSRQLLRYFGEKETKDCGQCDVCISHKKETKEDKLEQEQIRREILNLLADKKPHSISDLYQLKHDTYKVDSVLMYMTYEEEVFNDNGKITV